MTLTKTYYGESQQRADAVILNIFEETLTPASVAANTTAVEEFTVTGVRTTDKLLSVVPPTDMSVALAGAFISAADKVKMIFTNPTAGADTPESGTYQVTVLQ